MNSKDLRTPCFILDAAELRKLYRGFRDALKAHFAASEVAYSVKTNSNPALLRVLLEEGAAAEVVSDTEYDLACAMGFGHIVFNGPVKGKEHFLKALAAGHTVNIDSKRELQWLEELPAGTEAHVGLRVNVGLAEDETFSRFGFDAPELAHAIGQIHRIPGVRLAGLHLHRTSKTRSLEVYRAIAAKALGRPEEAYGYMQRYAELTRELSGKLLASEAQEYAARYRAKEQELAIRSAQDKSRVRGIILLLIALLLIVDLAATVLFLWQKRELERKNCALAAQIADTLKYKEQLQLPEEPTDLFEQLCLAIKRDRLFLDPAFDRQKLTELFHLSNRQVGAAFSQGSEFCSLSDFIRDCRLEYSCRLLTEHPELSIKEVAAKSGFQYASTYSTDFKSKYTMTPSEFRKLQAGK